MMDEVFRALADPSRRRLLDSLNERGGQTLSELCGQLDMARQSVSKHLAVLQEANVVTTVWRGREKLHYLNAEPINAIAERWIDRFSRERVHALADLKRVLEDTPAERFVYSIYIDTTPERLREALSAFSTAAFDVEPYGDQVRLTVVDEGERDWPIRLSNLKTALERA
jgi:DNA-binding transcriptional ArsR family regulator